MRPWSAQAASGVVSGLFGDTVLVHGVAQGASAGHRPRVSRRPTGSAVDSVTFSISPGDRLSRSSGVVWVCLIGERCSMSLDPYRWQTVKTAKISLPKPRSSTETSAIITSTNTITTTK